MFNGGGNFGVGLGKRKGHAIGHKEILAPTGPTAPPKYAGARLALETHGAACVDWEWMQRMQMSVWRANINLLPVLAAVLMLAPVQGQAPSIDPALLAKANGGDPAAQVAVGQKYAQAAGAAQDPDDVAEDRKQAFAWYRKAAEEGDIAGEIHVAESYSYGQGVARDMTKAAEWYRKAADQGDTEAQGRLAMLYTLGQGVPQSDPDAYFWFDIAASASTPNKDRYIENRQNVGTRITADELAAVKERLKKWKAAHPGAIQ